MPTVAKHIFLVQITSIGNFSYERIRLASTDYQDLLQSVSNIDRNISITGSAQFPTVTITLANRDLYFTKLLATVEHRNKAVTIQVIPPNSTTATTIFSGFITKGDIKGGVFTIQCTGHGFDELYGSALASVLPSLTKANFPDMPDGQVASAFPGLIYGQIASPFDNDLADPVAAGAVKANLIDITGMDRTMVGHTSGPAADKNVLCLIWVDSLSKFVASGYTGFATYSTDGISWTSSTPAAAASTQWNGLVYSSSLALIIAVGDGYTNSTSGIMSSTNGTSWSAVSSPGASEWWNSVCWSAELSMFVAVGTGPDTGKFCMTSLDGVTWTFQPGLAQGDWTGVAWSPSVGLFCAVGHGYGVVGTGIIATSPDGITWTARTSPSVGATNYGWNGICWSDQLKVFMITGSDDGFAASEDGITWLPSYTPEGANGIQSIIWDQDLGLFIAPARNLAGQALIISGDGVTWETVATPISGVGSTLYTVAAWSPSLKVLTMPLYLPQSDLQTATSPQGLWDQFRYALGARMIYGDPDNVGVLIHVFTYGAATPTHKTIQANVYGEFYIPTISFATDPRSSLDASQDRPEITFYAAGVTDQLTISNGTIIREGVSAISDLLTQYASASVSSLIDSTTFTSAIAAAKVQHLADLETGGIAPASMGFVVDQPSTTLQSVIETVNKSFAMMTYPTRAGKVGAIVSPIGALPATTVSFTDESSILKDSLTVTFPDEITTGWHPLYNYRYTSGQSGDPNPGPQFASKIPNWDIPTSLQRLFQGSISRAGGFVNFGPGITRDIELPYNRRAVSVINTLRAYHEYVHPGAQFIQFDIPISYYNTVEIGDYAAITHWQGISASGTGYVNDTVRVIGIGASLDPTNPRLTLNMHRRFPGTWLHDNFDRTPSSSLGADWNESEASSSSAFQITAGTGGADTTAVASFRQTNTLFCSSAANGIALNSQLSYPDQVASVCFVNRGATLMRAGVCCRGSGPYNNFTGYVALLEYDPTTPTLKVYLRKYINQDITSSTGTLMDTYTLDIPSTSTSTWLNQGDVLELRAVQTVSGHSNIEVLIWSDIPANNLGRVISMDDATIQANGQTSSFGMFCDYGGGHRITNFYGRSYYS